MKVLGTEDLFHVPDHSYDFLAEKSFPSYHEAHRTLITALCADINAEFDVIDLGVTSAYILKNYPNVRVTGIDLFDEMLDDARVQMGSFCDRVEHVKSDDKE